MFVCTVHALRWAQTNFLLSAHEYENSPLVSNSAHISFCMLKLKHPTEGTRRKTHFTVEGDFSKITHRTPLGLLTDTQLSQLFSHTSIQYLVGPLVQTLHTGEVGSSGEAAGCQSAGGWAEEGMTSWGIQEPMEETGCSWGSFTLILGSVEFIIVLNLNTDSTSVYLCCQLSQVGHLLSPKSRHPSTMLAA